jgi:hypothetical protein
LGTPKSRHVINVTLKIHFTLQLSQSQSNNHQPSHRRPEALQQYEFMPIAPSVCTSNEIHETSRESSILPQLLADVTWQIAACRT